MFTKSDLNSLVEVADVLDKAGQNKLASEVDAVLKRFAKHVKAEGEKGEESEEGGESMEVEDGSALPPTDAEDEAVGVSGGDEPFGGDVAIPDSVLGPSWYNLEFGDEMSDEGMDCPEPPCDDEGMESDLSAEAEMELEAASKWFKEKGLAKFATLTEKIISDLK